jgi:uncharacterized phage protein gp47/JayE
VFTDGTDANILIAATAAMGDEAIRHLASRMAALYLDSAQDEDLDRLVADRVSPELPRRQATRALVDISFTRSDTTSPVTIETGTVISTSESTAFTMLQDVSFSAGQAGPVSGLAQANRAGRAGNVAAGTITTIASPPQGDIVATNPSAAAGGQDVESNAEYRSRSKDFYKAARRATISAIEFGALTVPAISRVSVVEEIDAVGDPTGRVFVYISDTDGRANQALVDAVFDRLLEYRAAGIVPVITPGTPQLVDIAYNVQFGSNTDTVAAAGKIRSATVSALEGLRPGEILRVSNLLSIARSVPGVIVPQDAIVEPVGDLVPEAGVLLRTTTARVTVNGI